MQNCLAEAEIEYKDHISPSIYVPFRLKNKDDGSPMILIWSFGQQLPWTLPANLAIAVHPRETYIEVITQPKNLLGCRSTL